MEAPPPEQPGDGSGWDTGVVWILRNRATGGPLLVAPVSDSEIGDAATSTIRLATGGQMPKKLRKPPDAENPGDCGRFGIVGTAVAASAQRAKDGGARQGRGHLRTPLLGKLSGRIRLVVL